MASKPWLSFSYENPLKKRFEEKFFDDLPTGAGVYLMLDRLGSILYIGKAKNLKRRLQSYKNAKPGQVPEHTIEMLDRVSRIVWELQPSESHALAREYDLIREVKPMFNIAGTDPELDLYIAYKVERAPQAEVIHFRLSSYRCFEKGFRAFGSYNHRRKAKAGYGALLRLLYAATTTAERRFSFPARIARTSPAYSFSVPFVRGAREELDRFLRGQDDAFLHTLCAELLNNERIPPFVRPGLQNDLRAVAAFYESIRGIKLPRIVN